MEVLIIDDDSEDRVIVSEMLREIFPGISCTIKESGEDAIKYLRQPVTVPQFIFIDIHMHGMDGKETLLKIKSMKSYSRAKVIMYSGDNNEQERRIYQKLGAHAFVKKTRSSETLKGEILKAMNESGISPSMS